MGRSLNRVTLLGTLGRDAEVKNTPSGASVATLNIATERSWKDKQSGEWKKETDWHRVTAWRIENLVNYLTKGKQVLVEGRIQTRSYEKNGETRYVTEIIADNIILCGGNAGGGSERDDHAQQPVDDYVPF